MFILATARVVATTARSQRFFLSDIICIFTGSMTAANTHNYPNIYLYRRLVKAKMYIDQNYHLPIDLDNIADEACFSKYHFIRLFKKIYGNTPHQYLVHTRINHACRQLQAGIPIADACYAVGFESISTFTGLFKRITGSTPAAYRYAELTRKQMTRARPLHFIPGCFALQQQKSNFQEAE